MSKPVLIIGSSGLVGGALLRALQRRGSPVIGLGRDCAPPGISLDIREGDRVAGLVRELKPEAVALAAANPHVDYCELHPEETRAVNVAGSLNVAEACAAIGARLVFFSSDYVFDGRRGEYGEEDAPCPINEYGRQKAEVEKATLALGSANLVLRTSGIYGWHAKGKNFVMQVLARLKAGEAFRVNSEVRYNPTFADNLAEIAAELIARGQGGIFHVVGADRLPRVEFARLAAEVFGLDPALIEAVPDREFTAPAPRPQESSLRTAKVRAAVSIPLCGAREGLERMKLQKGGEM